MSMKVLVTGGFGFIGSNFVRRLVSAGTDTVVLDKLTYAGVQASLKDVKGFTFVKGDICSRTDVENAMKDCDAVVHFAAESHVDRSIKDVSPFVQANIIGTQYLLEAACKKSLKKFVMISTDEVYGQIERGKFKETDVLNPRNPYAATKAAADRLAYSFHATYGLPVVITRSSNNFGPFQYPEKVIPLFITNLLRGKKVPLYADGKNVRDWLYVADNCDAVYTCLEKGKPGEVYNISGGNELSNIELTHLILKELGCGEEMIEYVADRPGHDKRYALDGSKIAKELGWKPSRSFKTALKETVDWYRKNEWWWTPLKR